MELKKKMIIVNFVLQERFKTTKSSDCVPCPFNTYSDVQGRNSCLSCDAYSYALTGASSCTKRANCTSNDYQAVYGKCKDGQEPISYQWREPFVCYATFSLPPPSSRPCIACPGGTIRNTQTWNCDLCPDGTKSFADGTCSPCPSGTEATKGYFYENFESLPPFTSTGCTGQCGTNGWVVNNYANGSSEFSSGIGHDSVNSFIFFNFTADRSNLRFNLTFSLLCGDPSCTAVLSDDTNSVWRYFGWGSRRNDVISWTRNISQPNVVIKINFQKNSIYGFHSK